MKMPDPFSYWNNAIEMTRMMTEAHSVIGMRLMGMAGVWSVTDAEDELMISEKIEAMKHASTDATFVMMQGGTPDEIAAAAIKPYRKTTRANAERLGKRGLKES
jgi:hypothetical protein